MNLIMTPVLVSTSPKWLSLTKTTSLPSPYFFKSSATLHFQTKYYNWLHARNAENSTKCLGMTSRVNNIVGTACYSPKNAVTILPQRKEITHVDEIFESMEGWATDNILPMLKPAKECWQPQDLLPDPCSDGFYDQLRQLQARTEEVPDDYFVVLVGNMITEEALPTYHARLNATDIFHDHTGIDTTPWAVWARGWSAEENRHGDLLNKYLYLSGRVDMKQVETTIQYLIASGVDVGTWNNPYLWTIYTSFQERATAITHKNTAKLAMQRGDTKLAQICGIIASDEKRHESAYTKIAGKLFELDPNGMLVAFAYMMRRKIDMPAALMYDGYDDHLFQHFSHVASRIGVYTASEYRQILQHLVAKWNVDQLTGLSSQGREAQDYICKLPNRLSRLEHRARSMAIEAPTASFSWIFQHSRQ